MRSDGLTVCKGVGRLVAAHLGDLFESGFVNVADHSLGFGVRFAFRIEAALPVHPGSISVSRNTDRGAVVLDRKWSFDDAYV